MHVCVCVCVCLKKLSPHQVNPTPSNHCRGHYLSYLEAQVWAWLREESEGNAREGGEAHRKTGKEGEQVGRERGRVNRITKNKGSGRSERNGMEGKGGE